MSADVDWCINHLEVVGSPEHMTDFYATVSHGSIAIPEAIEEPRTDAIEYHFATYDMYLSAVNSVTFDGVFSTPWDPPVSQFVTLSRNHPHLTFTLNSSAVGEDSAEVNVIFDGYLIGHGNKDGRRYCANCHRYSYRLSQRTGALESLCDKCFFHHDMLPATAELLITASDEETLHHLAALLTPHTTVGAAVGEPLTAQATLLNKCAGLEGTSPNPFLAIMDEAGSRGEMGMRAERTPGGSISVLYNTFNGDDGTVLWGDLSAHHPNATFILNVTRTSAAPMLHVLARGNLITESLATI